jgi:hypothetical protein
MDGVPIADKAANETLFAIEYCTISIPIHIRIISRELCRRYLLIPPFLFVLD